MLIKLKTILMISYDLTANYKTLSILFQVYNLSMKVKQAVITIGQKIIQLVRQKCMLKYGSTVCVQKHVRMISQMQDLKRSYQARINVHAFRQFMKQKSGQLTLSEYLKVLNQIQAGNCGQMSILTYEILSAIVPPGLQVEIQCIKNPKDNESHDFVTIRPLDTKDKHQTLVIDPWPSNQIINPEVVSMNNFFLGDKDMETIDQFSKKSVRSNHVKLTTFDHIEMSDFDISKLQQIDEEIEKKEYLNDSKWNHQRMLILCSPQIDQLMKYKEHWQLFKHRRLDIRNVKKESPILLS